MLILELDVNSQCFGELAEFGLVRFGSSKEVLKRIKTISCDKYSKLAEMNV